MNFLTRFLIVILWMMGITASSLAATKKCAKIEKTTYRYSIQTTQTPKHTSSSNTDKTAAPCSSNVSLYCVKNEKTVTISDHRNRVIYIGFNIHATSIGFQSQPYSPPRQF